MKYAPRYEDGYRTKTNHELNDYKERLRQKIVGLMEYKDRWYKVGTYWIHTESQNTINNPNGRWKWNGWEITGKEYFVEYYTEENIKEENGSIKVTGCAEKRQYFTDKNEANAYFLEIKMELQ